MPDENFRYEAVDAEGRSLKPIPYRDIELNAPWRSFDIRHELTTKGIERFVNDYLNTLAPAA